MDENQSKSTAGVPKVSKPACPICDDTLGVMSAWGDLDEDAGKALTSMEAIMREHYPEAMRCSRCDHAWDEKLRRDAKLTTTMLSKLGKSAGRGWTGVPMVSAVEAADHRLESLEREIDKDLIARIRQLEAALVESCDIANEAESKFGALATERRMMRIAELRKLATP